MQIFQPKNKRIKRKMKFLEEVRTKKCDDEGEINDCFSEKYLYY